MACDVSFTFPGTPPKIDQQNKCEQRPGQMFFAELDFACMLENITPAGKEARNNETVNKGDEKCKMLFKTIPSLHHDRRTDKSDVSP